MSSSRTADEARVLLVAWDVSGDQNAGRLAAAIHRSSPAIELFGAGGPAMQAAGVDVQVRTTHLSFTGVLAVASRFRALLASYRRVREVVADLRPDLVVLIDSEWATLRLARRLRRLAIPAIFFFPPQFWLIGRWRAPRLVPLAERILCAFREEERLFRAAGADATWIGHPLRDAVSAVAASPEAVRAVGLDPSRPFVLLMPGSRRAEIRRLGPPIFGAARRLRSRDPSLQFAIPVAEASLRPAIERELAAAGLEGAVLCAPADYAVFRGARIAIQKSGTGSLETALLGIPSVIVYRLNPVEYLVGWYLLSHVRFIGMCNILLDEEVQPEFVQTGISPESIAEEAWSLLRDERRREAIRSRLSELPDLLGRPGAIERAAASVVEVARERRPANPRGLRARRIVE